MENTIYLDKLIAKAKLERARRKTVFNELESIIKNTIIPQLAEIMRVLNYEELYFNSNNIYILGQELYEYSLGKYMSVFVLLKNGQIAFCTFNHSKEEFTYENKDIVNLSDLCFTKKELVNLYKELVNRAEQLVLKRTKESDRVEELLNTIKTVKPNFNNSEDE